MSTTRSTPGQNRPARLTTTVPRAATPPRPAQAAPSDDATVTRGSKFDLMRMIAADVIRRLATASDAERMTMYLQLRTVQDEIARMKHRLPLLATKPSSLAWVDEWRPES